MDCDADALAFSVKQHGEPPAFCHKGSLSCWGVPSGLHALQLTLKQRKASAPPGSYTKRLFDDPILLRNKLVEEAQELSEAIEPDHVAAEAADLMYFAMTRCVAAGVSLDQIESHLDRRSLKLQRRPGNDKKERIEAAAKILEGCVPCDDQPNHYAPRPSLVRRLLPLTAAVAALAALAVQRAGGPEPASKAIIAAATTGIAAAKVAASSGIAALSDAVKKLKK